MAPILEIIDLQVHFPTERGPVKAVDGVSFALEPGERLGLIGESGSGKSTIALAIMRLIKPPGRIVDGEIILDGDDLLQLSDEEMRRRRLDSIAMVTQGAMNSLNPVIRIRPQLIDGMEAHGIKLTKREYDERIGELLDAVDLPHHVANLFPHQLSGGMKQRVCIATAISLRPKVIIADEPTSALDVVVQRHVMETLRKVQDRIGASVILIGLVAGYFGGKVDAALRVLIDVFLAVPSLIFLVLIASLMRGVSVSAMALIIGLFAWAWPARAIRSQALSLKERPFVPLARLSGVSDFEIVVRKILPHTFTWLGANFLNAFIAAILAESALSILGLGPQREMTLGTMIFWALSRGAILQNLWWWWLTPVVTLITLFMALYLVHLGLDEVGNPRLRTRA